MIVCRYTIAIPLVSSPFHHPNHNIYITQTVCRGDAATYIPRHIVNDAYIISIIRRYKGHLVSDTGYRQILQCPNKEEYRRDIVTMYITYIMHS